MIISRKETCDQDRLAFDGKQILTPWAAACQASLSREFSRQEYWNGWLFPSSKDPPGSRDGSRVSSALQVDSLPSESPGKPIYLSSSKRTLGSFINPVTITASRNQNGISKFPIKTIFWAGWQWRCEFYMLVKSIRLGSVGVRCRLSSIFMDHKILIWVYC